MQRTNSVYFTTHDRYLSQGQEKIDEISGAGNHNTAMFWEYDNRIGRRWNLDPIYNTDISRYATNGNNPNYFLDPKGDFKTKFGAKVYKFFHGGEIGLNKNNNSIFKGEWYVSSKIEGLQGHKGLGKQKDGSIDLDEVVIGLKLNYGWKGKYNPANGIDLTANGLNYSVYFLKNNASNIWNSSFARNIIPDYYTFSLSFQTSSGTYMNEEISLTLMLRGKDPGLYINTTTGFGGMSSVGVDVGCSIGKGYYNGTNPRKLSSSMIGGWQASGGIGVGLKTIVGGSVNGGVDVGLNEKNEISTKTNKVGISLGVGVSTPILQGNIGAGKATSPIPIIKF